MLATDAAGNLGSYSGIASATTQAVADATPPSVPAGLTAKAASATRIDLAWNASVDNIVVKGYRVERCQGTTCTNFTEVATVTGTAFSNTALTSNTSIASACARPTRREYERVLERGQRRYH